MKEKPWHFRSQIKFGSARPRRAGAGFRSRRKFVDSARNGKTSRLWDLKDITESISRRSLPEELRVLMHYIREQSTAIKRARHVSVPSYQVD